MTPASAIYEGRVRHRRFTPVDHCFSYPLFMMYLDLAELPALFDGHWLWSARRPALAYFRRQDFLPSAAPNGEAGAPIEDLDEAVRRLVAARTGRRPAGPIRLLTHLRHFGHQMNPVSFYYCCTPAGDGVEAIVAEVNNTPWNERHCYVLDAPCEGDTTGHRLYRLAKEFHVSPFMSMNIDYAWRFTVPGSRLLVHMENRVADRKIFDATLTLVRREISAATLRRVLAGYPLMTLRVSAWIYLQAFRLWRRRVPFFPHPGKGKLSEERCL